MILPIEVGKPNYRDSESQYVYESPECAAALTSGLRANGLLSGYAPLNMSPMMRGSEVTAPGKQ